MISDKIGCLISSKYHLISVILSHLQTTPQGARSVSLLKGQRLKLDVEYHHQALFVHDVRSLVLNNISNVFDLWLDA